MVSEVTEVHARYFADYSARDSTKTHVASKLGSVTVLLRLVRQESGENWDKRCLRMAQRGFSPVHARLVAKSKYGSSP